MPDVELIDVLEIIRRSHRSIELCSRRFVATVLPAELDAVAYRPAPFVLGKVLCPGLTKLIQGISVSFGE